MQLPKRLSRLPIRSGKFLLILLLGVYPSGVANGSGPRWVTGPPYFTTVSQPVIWYTTSPRYFTDPGDLSEFVDHASADAIVSAAAGVWNVPTSSLTLAKGGELAEHVSSQNVYSGADGLVFPTDVTSTNYAAIQIAVIFDSDGSITDLLLGQGASEPENCPQAAVTESVDSITPAGNIQHALLILNGRCTGALPEQQLQLQYQLMRAFGRVLGLGWSQTNDNVFTASPPATNDDITKWPIMHPIDIVCGAYTYQCMPNPFTLRPDDIGSISQLYFIARNSAPAGKVDTLSNASAITGNLRFANGQGMQGVNLLVRRHFPASEFVDEGPVVSAVTGQLFRWSNGNPVTGPPALTIGASMGNGNTRIEGGFNLPYIPRLPHAVLQDAIITSEPINPLYIGQYGIGPYHDAPVTPSGSSLRIQDNGIFPYESNFYDVTMSDSAKSCVTTGTDSLIALGSKTVPVPFPASGWSNGSLCAYGVSGWSTVTVQGNRSLTVETTALDEQGLVTENKLQPLIGVWELADANNSLPTVAAATTPFNSIAGGLTSLNVQPLQGGPLRIVVADERGDGRPDFSFRERILYADTITPSLVPAGGGLVTITGMGFRPGNEVTIGGVPVTVLGSTATSILIVAPPFAALGAGASVTADVGIIDLMSGGSSYMYGALSYPASAIPPQAPALVVLSPQFYVAAGQSVALSPLVAISTAGAAAPNIPVTWSTSSNVLTFPAGAKSVSDSNGLATIVAIAGQLQGTAQVVGSGCALVGTNPGGQSGSEPNLCGAFTVTAVDASLWTVTAVEGGIQSVTSNSVLLPIVFLVTDGAGHPVIGVPVAIYQTVSAYQICPGHGACPIAEVYQTAQTSAMSDANGIVTVTPQQLTGIPETSTVAASCGMQGFISVSLQKAP